MHYEIHYRVSPRYSKKYAQDIEGYQPGREAAGRYTTLAEARQALVAEVRDSASGEYDSEVDLNKDDPLVIHDETTAVQFHVAKALASVARVGQVVRVNDFDHKIVRVKW